MLELTPTQIENIIARQSYIENEILGLDKESQEIIMGYHGGQAKFYKKWLWDYLNLSEFCDSEQPGEVLELNMEGDEHAKL